jgi:hypothetical protein
VVESFPEPLLESESDSKITNEVQSQHESTIDQSNRTVGGTEQDAVTSSPVEEIEFYDLFLMKVQAMCSDTPKTTDELVDALEINKSQLNAWLKKAVSDKKLKKLSKPVRYQWVTTEQGSLLL